MTPKMTALRNTLGVVAAGIGTALLVSVIVANFNLVQIVIGVAVLLVFGLLKMVYNLELEKARRVESLKD